MIEPIDLSEISIMFSMADLPRIWYDASRRRILTRITKIGTPLIHKYNRDLVYAEENFVSQPSSVREVRSLSTQVDIISSERVARKVVRMLRLDENPIVK